MGTLDIRPATADDAAALVDIWHAGWHDAHRGHVPDALCATRDRGFFVERAAGFASGFVAVSSEEVVAFTLVDGAQLDQLYVAAPWRGRGAGALLTCAAEEAIRSAGFDEAWLMVAAGNHSARRFYSRRGWSDSGASTVTLDSPSGSVSVVAHRYVKRLG